MYTSPYNVASRSGIEIENGTHSRLYPQQSGVYALSVRMIGI